MAINDTTLRVAAALELADGTFAPAVLLPTVSGYWARVAKYSTSKGLAVGLARRSMPTQGYHNDNWTNYTNGTAPSEWFEREGFVLCQQ